MYEILATKANVEIIESRICEITAREARARCTGYQGASKEARDASGFGGQTDEATGFIR